MTQRIRLTPEDAAAIARVIEDGVDRIADGPQRIAADLVAHKLLTATSDVVIELNVPDESEQR